MDSSRQRQNRNNKKVEIVRVHAGLQGDLTPSGFILQAKERYGKGEDQHTSGVHVEDLRIGRVVCV